MVGDSCVSVCVCVCVRVCICVGVLLVEDVIDVVEERGTGSVAGTSVDAGTRRFCGCTSLDGCLCGCFCGCFCCTGSFSPVIPVALYLTSFFIAGLSGAPVRLGGPGRLELVLPGRPGRGRRWDAFCGTGCRGGDFGGPTRFGPGFEPIRPSSPPLRTGVRLLLPGFEIRCFAGGVFFIGAFVGATAALSPPTVAPTDDTVDADSEVTIAVVGIPGRW
mmetsp:Transcript_3159/g.7610  ORF Transcript_3159/g.7610 Transcript_3159/m.7610 type:complete len:218 (-) Transcript_3159:263-916(-)